MNCRSYRVDVSETAKNLWAQLEQPERAELESAFKTLERPEGHRALVPIRLPTGLCQLARTAQFMIFVAADDVQCRVTILLFERRPNLRLT